jgi:hypothetical protein
MKILLAGLVLAISVFAQSVTISAPVFAGTGLNDATSGGAFVSFPANAVYVATISAAGTPDHFTWTKNGGSPSSSTAITGGTCALPVVVGSRGWQALADGVDVCWLATTGHTLAASWTITAQASGSAVGITTIQAGPGASFVPQQTINRQIFYSAFGGTPSPSNPIGVDTFGNIRIPAAYPGLQAVNTGTGLVNSLGVIGTLFARDNLVSDQQGGVLDGGALYFGVADPPYSTGYMTANHVLRNQIIRSVSVTSLTLGTGSTTFSAQTGVAFVAAQAVSICSAGVPAACFIGTITSYNSGTGSLVVSVTSVTGSGTFADWIIEATGSSTDTRARFGGSSTTCQGISDQHEFPDCLPGEYKIFTVVQGGVQEHIQFDQKMSIYPGGVSYGGMTATVIAVTPVGTTSAILLYDAPPTVTRSDVTLAGFTGGCAVLNGAQTATYREDGVSLTIAPVNASACSYSGTAGQIVVASRAGIPGFPAVEGYSAFFPVNMDTANLFLDSASTIAVPGITALGTTLNPNQVGLTTFTGNQNQFTMTGSFDGAGTFYFQNSRSPLPWAVGTTYSAGNLVTSPTDSNIYASVANGNIGNDPTMTTPADWTLIGPARLSNVRAADFIFQNQGGRVGIGMAPLVPLDVSGIIRANGADNTGSLVASQEDSRVFPQSLILAGRINQNQQFYAGLNTFPKGSSITVVTPTLCPPITGTACTIFTTAETPNTGQAIILSGYLGVCAFLNGAQTPTVVAAGNFFSIPVNGTACTPSQSSGQWDDATGTPGDYAILQCAIESSGRGCLTKINPASGDLQLGANAYLTQAGALTVTSCAAGCTPQLLRTTDSPTFANLTLTGTLASSNINTSSGAIYNDVSGSGYIVRNLSGFATAFSVTPLGVGNLAGALTIGGVLASSNINTSAGAIYEDVTGLGLVIRDAGGGFVTTASITPAGVLSVSSCLAGCVTSVGGADGTLLLGSGLGVTGSTINNTGVLSINGAVGALTGVNKTDTFVTSVTPSTTSAITSLNTSTVVTSISVNSCVALPCSTVVFTTGPAVTSGGSSTVLSAISAPTATGTYANGIHQ